MKTYRILLVVFAIGIAAAVGWWLYVRNAAITAAVEDETKAHIASFILGETPKYVVPDDFKNKSAAHTAEVFGMFWNAIQSPDYVRFKIWDTNQTIIWSNLPELIGQRFTDNEELNDSLKGEITFDVEQLKSEHIGERQYDELGEIYVPVRDNGGSVAGVIEVYEPTTALRAEVARRFGAALVLPIVSGAVLYLCIAFGIRFLCRKKEPSSA